jgi:sugar/nucleoside kinase (ribokinase family)
MSTLLIAGPLALDDLAQGTGLIGGVGGYAAIAAAPLARTQLWARGGTGYTPQLRSILERRAIDLSGTSWEGATPRGAAQGFLANGPLLSDVEPTSAEDLGGVLLIGLPPEEWRIAQDAVKRLPGGDTRLLVASPRPDDLREPAFRTLCCSAADILVLSARRAIALSAAATPLGAARFFQELGAKSVVLTAGMLGGLLVYRQKVVTYPAMPLEVVDPTGTSAVFPGALAAWCAGADKDDFRTIKRGCAVASAVAGICLQGIGPKKLLAADRKEYLERYNRLHRLAKF